GVSLAPFDSLNLGLHVGDDPLAVTENRRRLSSEIRQISPLFQVITCLFQLHRNRVVEPGAEAEAALMQADALYARRRGRALAIMTADCLPVFLAASDGREIALAHAGWRGLVDGILEAAIARFSASPATILAHLGPAIGPSAFEVGEDVRNAFLGRSSLHDRAFHPAPARNGARYRCDLYALATQILHGLGISVVSGGDACTLTQDHRYFSYRRDGQTGRMASLIWLD